MLDNILQWFAAAKQQPQVPTPNPRQVAFYIGMQIEELHEKLSAVMPHGPSTHFFLADLERMAIAFKDGTYDGHVTKALRVQPKDLLDADVDLLWVSLGAARAQGANVPGAVQAVIDANWRKRWMDGEFHLDPVTGKVLKPGGWTPPNLTEFVHSSLRNNT